MTDTPTDPADLRFEDAIAELESIIEQIDAGKIGLEEAMVAHRRGQSLAARCRSVLDAVERELETTDPTGADDRLIQHLQRLPRACLHRVPERFLRRALRPPIRRGRVRHRHESFESPRMRAFAAQGVRAASLHDAARCLQSLADRGR